MYTRSCSSNLIPCHKYYRSTKHTWKNVVIAVGSNIAGQNPDGAEKLAKGKYSIIIIELAIILSYRCLPKLCTSSKVIYS